MADMMVEKLETCTAVVMVVMRVIYSESAKAGMMVCFLAV